MRMVFVPTAPSGMRCLLRGAAVHALGGGRPRDGDVGISDLRRRVARVGGERVLEVLHVVAGLEIVEALVGAARFASLERRMRNGARYVELEAELDRREPFGVPSLGMILQAHLLPALGEARKR